MACAGEPVVAVHDGVVLLDRCTFCTGPAAIGYGSLRSMGDPCARTSECLREERIEAVGPALMRLDQAMTDLRGRFGIPEAELNLDLGTLLPER
jgi:hypothetical protein